MSSGTLVMIAAAICAGITLMFGLLYLSAKIKNGRKGNVHTDGPERFRVRGVGYRVHSVTGAIRGAGTVMETHTHVSGNAQHVRSSNTTYQHDQFFIEKPDGKEMEVSLTNSGIRVRDGHLLTAVWLIRDHASWGSFVHFHNHNTGQDVALAAPLRSMVKPSKVTLLWFLCFAAFAGATLFLAAILGLTQLPEEKVMALLEVDPGVLGVLPGFFFFAFMPLSIIVFFARRSTVVRSRIRAIQQGVVAPVVEQAKATAIVGSGDAHVQGMA